MIRAEAVLEPKSAFMRASHCSKGGWISIDRNFPDEISCVVSSLEFGAFVFEGEVPVDSALRIGLVGLVLCHSTRAIRNVLQCVLNHQSQCSGRIVSEGLCVA